MDLSEIPATPYPEGVPVTVMRNGHGAVPVAATQVKELA
jgi:hypothetical protein